MPEEARKIKFVIVAVDYFTKWAEAKLFVTFFEPSVQAFAWKNVICRFGSPKVILTDHGW